MHYSDLVVLSHLRWNFVYQRPQHIMTQLASKRKILFVEEPSIEKELRLHVLPAIERPLKNLIVLHPKYANKPGDITLAEMILSQMKLFDIEKPILWFYSPAFVTLAPMIPHSGIVYDCMDQLTLFRFAPKELEKNEKKLLSLADVVFAGGKSLFRDKSRFNPNTYLFPSSIDADHFKQADRTQLPIPSDIASIRHPIAGYHGVIDERIDYELLDRLSTRLPQVSFVFIGPTTKIDKETLPYRSNIHYLGQKDYRSLPAYLAAFDVAIMPFEANDSTTYISPTKTLEFMASGIPTVSTLIYDIYTDYADVVTIAGDDRAFAAAISYYLNEPTLLKKKRIEKQKRIVSKTSWEDTAKEMSRLMETAILKKEKSQPAEDIKTYGQPFENYGSVITEISK